VPTEYTAGSQSKTPRDPYLVKSVVHASQLLKAFHSSGEALPLREVARRSSLSKSMVFRLLHTLEACGLVEKAGENLYRSAIRPLRQRSWRIGYAAQGADYGFSKEVSASLQQAAAEEGVELISVDNHYSAKTAQRNADFLVRENVDLVIEFQTDDEVAPVVAEKYRAAGIPLVAIEVPHPGATYYGANNFEAGLIAGRCLGRWLKRRWQEEAGEILLLELARAGNLPRMRLTGILAGIREVVPHAGDCPIAYINGDGRFKESLEATRKHLRAAKPGRTLVGAINDASALGALRAFEEAGRADLCAVVGHNASPEGRAELRQPNSRLIGSVAYFAERYGEELIRVSLDILNRRPVPPAVFVKHQLITRENVDRVYPNDSLFGIVGTGHVRSRE
jgi:ribose transport system substrate-binding protein